MPYLRIVAPNIKKMNYTDILKQAIDTYGVDAQLKMVIEEAAEVTKAICKADRLGMIAPGGLEKPSMNMPQNKIEAYHNLVDEAADLSIMAEQLNIMVGIENVKLVIQRKLERLNNRLNSSKDKKSPNLTVSITCSHCQGVSTSVLILENSRKVFFRCNDCKSESVKDKSELHLIDLFESIRL